MEINFTEDYLKELYEEGKTKNKKYRFQKDIIKKYKQTIDKLRVAKNIEDLYPIKSLNYEKLIGNKKGIESVRVDKKYRIEFISSVEGEEPNTITICSIIDLSNHYS
ncbi:Plasmid maintenance system killer protein [Flavobacterium psychrophilum]|uniref:type II toxin-antitoxin system RelE/ParE family toxin n=1 Tax=Flavobacterium psychrophilum TaxID=96345 RepID=UPI000B7C54C2|nr:type II toxin-antitoxin system RelE/ParE family toxin [Flavobacterium psychrophilum]MCB6062653.1 type II toxin-antitoxin system RelE/ParE family toxin [Flavobacterium psychrophilum]SNB43002.1 Plasmid maintenance system killer protein [Flavobacterium psychrophilum]